jgi:hypothetical protein
LGSDGPSAASSELLQAPCSFLGPKAVRLFLAQIVETGQEFFCHGRAIIGVQAQHTFQNFG